MQQNGVGWKSNVGSGRERVQLTGVVSEASNGGLNISHLQVVGCHSEEKMEIKEDE